jgi:hypothetical protein
MRHFLTFTLVLACFAALFLACYAPVFVQDRQFGFRDAAYYYYPLYQRVQQEWDKGRWPLWEPEENAGIPLLGNPTAAVLYPGKLIYAWLPYAWGARIYVVAHTALAFGAMLVLMRSWRTSWVGSGLSALAYAFGAPVLFQNSNIIFLVGAAWLPLGFHAVDCWVRLGRRWGLLELAVVLAMQMLGGDPQSAYLLGLSAVGYAAGLALGRARANRNATAVGANVELRRAGSRRWFIVPLAVLGFGSWVALTVFLAKWLPTVRPPKNNPPMPPIPWMPVIVNVTWGLAGFAFLAYRRNRGWRFTLGRTGQGLLLSAALATALSAAQLFPVIEFTQQTARTATAGPHDIYPFSIEPARLVELVWPNMLGIQFGGNTYWHDMIRLPGVRQKIWVPSLYMGGLTLVLALSAPAFRRAAPGRVWLSVIVVVSLLGSLGPYTSPIWAARVLATRSNESRPNVLTRGIGPLDAEGCPPIRLDQFLRDGDGGVYWWLATGLPGFRQFRFPAKLFTFTTLGLTALAGLGWDSLKTGPTRRITALLLSLMGLSVVVLAGVLIERSTILTAFRGFSSGSLFGPFDPDGGYAALVRGLVQALIVFGLGLIAVRLVRTRPFWAGTIGLIAMSTDLAVANARYVLTIPQAILETRPEVLRIIEEAERANPALGPYRVYRMPTWRPLSWPSTPSTNRVEELVAWERNTLQPKYGITLGVDYTHTMGVDKLSEYERYFGAFPRMVRTPEMAHALNVEIGHKVIYFPRRAFDLWNTRYFVVPVHANGWNDEYRAYASFLIESESIYPDLGPFRGPKSAEAYKDWVDHHDFQVLRNLHEAPRAWVVHDVRISRPIRGPSQDDRPDAMQEMIYADDPIWHDSNMRAFDPLTVAWVERDQYKELAASLRGDQSKGAETVKVSYPSPQRAELEATLESPGLVVLADVDYPGWELTIDSTPARIHRVNFLMRGAVVQAGKHRLVYTYAPRSFRIGRVVSLLGLGAMALLAVAFTLRSVDPVIRDQLEHTSLEVRC